MSFLLDQGIALLREEVNKRSRQPITIFTVVEQRGTCVALKFKKHYIVIHSPCDSDPPELVYYVRRKEEEALSTLENIESDGRSYYGYDDVCDVVSDMFEDQ